MGGRENINDRVSKTEDKVVGTLPFQINFWSNKQVGLNYKITSYFLNM